MCVSPKLCEAWVSLESAGIKSSGCLRSPQWMQDCVIPCNQSITHPATYIDLPTFTLTCVRTVAHGAFGYIDVAHMKTSEGIKEVYVKRPIVAGKPLFQEACIQHWVSQKLHQAGFFHGAPRVLRIFALRDHSICFAMEMIEGSITLDQFLQELPTARLGNVLYESLMQISSILWFITNILGMNHRDVKPSNFLILEHEPITRSLLIDSKRVPFTTTLSLTFIDFGFSCIGSPTTQIVQLSLSRVFSSSDPCPKEGRDLFLLLALLYIDYHEELGTLLPVFESWLQDAGPSLCRMMRQDKESSIKWLYFITANEQIKRFCTTPSRIIQDLQKWNSLRSPQDKTDR